MNWVRGELAFLLILLAAGLVRVELARTASYIHDEENTSIPLARQISFEPGNRYLPLRAVNHPALPAYFVKAGSTLVGPTPFEYRAAHVVAGLLAVVLVYLLARQAYGAWAGCWAAALLAFNEYFLTISSRATAHGPYLLFATAALYAFSRCLMTGRAFSCIWRAAPQGWRSTAKSTRCCCCRPFPDPAAAAAPALAAPAAPVPGFCCVRDADRARRAVEPGGRSWVDRVTYGNRDQAQATYASHLKRIGGIGLSPYPFAFYAREPVMAVYQWVTGRRSTTIRPSIGARSRPLACCCSPPCS